MEREWKVAVENREIERESEGLEEKRRHAPVLFSYIFSQLKSFVLRAK